MALIAVILLIVSLYDMASEIKSLSPPQFNELASVATLQENSLIRLGGAFSILSSSYGLGVYSFIMYDFNPYRADKQSERQYFYMTIAGLFIVSVLFVASGSIVHSFNSDLRFITLI